MPIDTANPTLDFHTLAEHRSYLMKVARLQLRDEHLAEDCVSDVLTQAFEKRASFRGGSSLRTWLTAILKNRIVDLLRKQWREQPLELPNDEGGDDQIDRLFDAGGHYAQMPSEVRDPAELCQQDGFLAAVQRCVDMLPKRVGQVFVLRLRGPSVMAAGVSGVLAEHLLQQHDIGPHAADRVAQLGQDESAPPDIQAHVDVEAKHAELRHRHVLGSLVPNGPAILALDG